MQQSTDQSPKDGKRITVRVDPALHREVRIKALQQGQDLSEVIRSLLLMWLEEKCKPEGGDNT